MYFLGKSFKYFGRNIKYSHCLHILIANVETILNTEFLVKLVIYLYTKLRVPSSIALTVNAIKLETS
jgi:hypothetical protein